MRFQVKHVLIFNNTKVGYRIVNSKGTEFDIAIEDAQLAIDDFQAITGAGTPIDLEDINGKLYPKDKNIPDVLVMDYKTIALSEGHKTLMETDVDLKLLYNKYNKLYFNSELPFDVPVYWSNKMTRAAGLCYWKRKRAVHNQTVYSDFKIGLSIHYNSRFPHELTDTLVHEMIHIKYPGDHHGSAFIREMNRLNNLYNLGITVAATGSAVVNFFYECDRCGNIYERRSRLRNLSRYNCKCGGSLIEDAVDDWA